MIFAVFDHHDAGRHRGWWTEAVEMTKEGAAFHQAQQGVLDVGLRAGVDEEVASQDQDGLGRPEWRGRWTAIGAGPGLGCSRSERWFVTCGTGG